MAGQTQGKNGRAQESAPPAPNSVASASNVRNLAGVSRKGGQRARAAATEAPAEVHVLPSAKPKMPAATYSEKVELALAEDGDPAKMLSDVRDVLFGPTRKLQEARLEEMLGILEQMDSEVQAANAGINTRIATLDATTTQHAQALVATNGTLQAYAEQHARDMAEVAEKMEALSSWLSREMTRMAATQKSEQDQQANHFNAQLERQSKEFSHVISEMVEHHKLAIQTVITDFSSHLKDLSTRAKADDDRILAHLEARATQIEATIEESKRLNVKVMSEGLIGLTEQLQTL